jgi:hypothetical protein
MWRSSAAREKLPLAASARKSSSQDRFMGGALQAWKARIQALAPARAFGDDRGIQEKP